MLTQKKGKPARLYILEDDEKLLDKLSQQTGVAQTTIMTLIVSAGLKCCAENGYRLPLPLKFEMAPGSATEAERPLTKIRR